MPIVYVDDFKMSGPKANLVKGWKLVRADLNVDELEPANRYLGCDNKKYATDIPWDFNPRYGWQDTDPTEKVRPRLIVTRRWWGSRKRTKASPRRILDLPVSRQLL